MQMILAQTLTSLMLQMSNDSSDSVAPDIVTDDNFQSECHEDPLRSTIDGRTCFTSPRKYLSSKRSPKKTGGVRKHRKVSYHNIASDRKFICCKVSHLQAMTSDKFRQHRQHFWNILSNRSSRKEWILNLLISEFHANVSLVLVIQSYLSVEVK